MKAVSIALMCAVLGCSAVPVLASAQATNAAAARQQSGDGAAITVLQQQLGQRPDWTDGWWQLGTLAYEGDHFETAVKALRKVVEAAPQMGTAWSLLGLSEFELQQFTSARADLEHAAGLGYGDDDEVKRVSAYHLALLFIRDGAFDQASALLLKIVGGAQTAQASYALGLAALRVPLLPSQVAPSQESLLTAVGGIVAQGDAGLAQFSAFVDAHPDLPLLGYAYGLALHRAGRNADALAAMRREVQRFPDEAVAWHAVFQLAVTMGQTIEAGQALRKAAVLEAAEAKDPDLARWKGHDESSDAPKQAVWARAMQSYAAKDYPAAMADLTLWLRTHPEEGTAWAVLGLCEFERDDADNALLHLQRGESLGMRGDARSVETAQYTTGVLLLRKGEFDAAAAVLGSAAKANPADLRVTDALGLTLLRRTNAQPAGVQDGALVRAAGQIALRLQESRYDEAFAAFRVLVKEHPSTPFLHYAFGTALMALSEFSEAAAQMRAESTLSPQSPLPQIRLASIALRQQKPDEALGPARRAAVLAPDSAEAHYLLGRALLETGDSHAAVGELQRASILNPGSPEVHFNLARAYARAEDAAAAARERATFARLNEASQAQRSAAGQQLYAGPRAGTSLTGAAGSARQP